MATICTSLTPQFKEENKQGIVYIAGLSGEGRSEKRLKAESTVRGVLCADMSSKEFLSLHSSVIRAATNRESPTVFSVAEPNAEEEADRKTANQSDIWSLIQAQKPSLTLPTMNSPYHVHSLVRRSSGSLSTRSLELCTESLGSETGSDCTEGMETAPSLEESAEGDFISQIKVRKRERLVPQEENSVNYNCTTSWKSPARSFPPPLPSISRIDGPCLHVKPHRQDGRLVLEAVKVPSHGYLHAQRENGRLLLSFVSTTQHHKFLVRREKKEEEEGKRNHHFDVVEEEEHEIYEEEVVDDDDEKEMQKEDVISDDEAKEMTLKECNEEEEVSAERWRRTTGRGVMELHRSIEKIICQPLMNINPWRPAANKEDVIDSGTFEEKHEAVEQRQNVYECFWGARERCSWWARRGEGGEVRCTQEGAGLGGKWARTH